MDGAKIDRYQFHNDKIAFAARLNRQLMQAADHRDTEKSFLYLDL